MTALFLRNQIACWAEMLGSLKSFEKWKIVGLILLFSVQFGFRKQKEEKRTEKRKTISRVGYNIIVSK